MAAHGGGGAVAVAGGQQVEQRAPEDGEDERALRDRRSAAALSLRLRRGQQLEPVRDRRAGEVGPRPVGLDQRSCVGLSPESQQRPVLGGRQPVPDGGGDRVQLGLVVAVSEPVQELQLIHTGAREQRPKAGLGLDGRNR